MRSINQTQAAYDDDDNRCYGVDIYPFNRSQSRVYGRNDDAATKVQERTRDCTQGLGVWLETGRGKGRTKVRPLRAIEYPNIALQWSEAGAR